ncbi:F-box/kelch-repeat protein [Acorus calamus]|uniref:F-box/kelch-repeat protein n=1 Tax=Acorus calamus TaxID=4465 RepID=A0AAV9FA14_ACOCL|nr:F-box/kelch-repeat protein [Acorus calamus]
MACSIVFNRSMSGGRTGGDGSLAKEFGGLRLSGRLVRSVSRRLKRKAGRRGGEDVGGRIPHSGCLGVYSKPRGGGGGGGGCRVGVDTTCDDFRGCRRRGGVAGGGRPTKATPNEAAAEEARFQLPDDVLEMCLARLPLSSLMSARLVCRRWRVLTKTPHFDRMRSPHRTPWLFLFGVSPGRVHALDISLDRWHRIDAFDALHGRFSYSVITIGRDIYVVGGRSSAAGSGTLRTHRGVWVFTPLSNTWRKASPMRSQRSAPVVGVFEVRRGCPDFKTDRRACIPRSRTSGASDVYEDPHRLSIRRQESRPSKARESSDSSAKAFVLIAVGGQGNWDEPLETAEIYNPTSDRWIEIAKLPSDFGVVCSGAVCKNRFFVCSESNKLAFYDLESGIWVGVQIARSPPRLHEYCPKLVSGSDHRLFMLCVSWYERRQLLNTREEAVRKMWELDMNARAWREVSRHPDAPMDWNAAFVADGGLIFGLEMFKVFGQALDFLTVCDVSEAVPRWRHISRKNGAVQYNADASSCLAKSMAVLNL